MTSRRSAGYGGALKNYSPNGIYIRWKEGGEKERPSWVERERERCVSEVPSALISSGLGSAMPARSMPLRRGILSVASPEECCANPERYSRTPETYLSPSRVSRNLARTCGRFGYDSSARRIYYREATGGDIFEATVERCNFSSLLLPSPPDTEKSILFSSSYVQAESRKLCPSALGAINRVAAIFGNFGPQPPVVAPRVARRARALPTTRRVNVRGCAKPFPLDRVRRAFFPPHIRERVHRGCVRVHRKNDICIRNVQTRAETNESITDMTEGLPFFPLLRPLYRDPEITCRRIIIRGSNRDPSFSSLARSRLSAGHAK